MRAVRIRTEYLYDPIGIDERRPQLMWNCEGDIRQTAYRIQARSLPAGIPSSGEWDADTLLWDTGKVSSSCMRARYDGKALGSRSRVEWHVCLWNEKDEAGEWSAEGKFELGLLKVTDWTARWIDPELPEKSGKKKEPKPPAGLGKRAERQFRRDWEGRRPAAYLRKTFSLEKTPEAARMYVTAHGIYDIWINQAHVDGYLLAPGNCQVGERLQVQTYDVTGYVRPGENEILATLGDGWYRGCVNYDMKTASFGEDIALLLQLEADGAPAAATGPGWTASSDGPLGLNDMMMGEYVDARKAGGVWHPVSIANFGYRNLTGTDTCPVTGHEVFSPDVLTTPAGETVLDFGQVIAGFVQMDIEAQEGETLVLTHGETLDSSGNFTSGNFQNPASPRCYQQVHYICRRGRNSYHPTKCYFGFRYVKLEGDWVIRNLTRKNGKNVFRQGAFSAIAVYSDMEETGQFTCGNSEVNRLVENVRWSMKSNFVDIPTDCPTREKSGYSGDCQIFSHTAMYLMECYPVLRRWLREQAATQFSDGCVRQIAPCNDKRNAHDGSAGWSDSFVIVPWRMAGRYGDLSLAEELYDRIRDYTQFCLNRAVKTRLRNAGVRKDLKPYLNDQGVHWGEWLEPGSNPILESVRTRALGAFEEATAYLAFDCRLTAHLAERLGKKEDAAYFAAAGRKAREAYAAEFLKKGRVPKSRRQCLYVRPLSMGLLRPELNYLTAEELAENVRKNNNHLNTGFLSTHELCRVLTDYGQVSAAYDLLLQTEEPGWIYEIRKGATTVWEQWDGIDKKGNVRGSLNHCSFGAIAGWLFDRVLGIVVKDGKILICPYPDSRLRYAEGSYLSPLGMIRSGWEYIGDDVEIRVTIPANTTATVILPDGRQMEVTAGEHRFI